MILLLMFMRTCDGGLCNTQSPEPTISTLLRRPNQGPDSYMYIHLRPSLPSKRKLDLCIKVEGQEENTGHGAVIGVFNLTFAGTWSQLKASYCRGTIGQAFKGRLSV